MLAQTFEVISSFLGNDLERLYKPVRNTSNTIPQKAAIRPLIESWLSANFSQQCLRRMLLVVYERSSWHASYGVREWCAAHRANIAYLDVVLDMMAQEESVAA